MRQLQLSLLILGLGMVIPAYGQVTTYCCDATAEAQYLADLATIVPSATSMAEGFESAPWVPSHTAVQVSATNHGITWARSGHGIRTSTGGGDVHEGSYLFYAIQLAMPFHPVPDGFTLTSDGTNLHGVGGWFRGQGQASKLAFTLDGDADRVNFTGEDATVSDWKFLGFIDTNAFMTVDILTADEVGNETTIFFADDFNIAKTQPSVDGDYDGDGNSDILWRHGVSGRNVVHLMDGSTVLDNAWVSTIGDPQWEVVGKGDYNGDRNADILWRHAGSGRNVVHLMDGATILSNSWVSTISDLQWKVVGSGDFDGDGNSDVLWRHDTSGRNVVHLMDGATILGNSWISTISDFQWQVVGNGDYDGDGNSDILWRHAASGRNVVHLMDGASILSNAWVSTISDLQWKVVGSGDYDGDGNSDILWRHNTSGRNVVHLMDGVTILDNAWVSTIGDLQWKVVGSGDYDGDGNSDTLWRHGVSGRNVVHLMNGATILSNTWVSTVGDAFWKIIYTD